MWYRFTLVITQKAHVESICLKTVCGFGVPRFSHGRGVVENELGNNQCVGSAGRWVNGPDISKYNINCFKENANPDNQAD